MSFLAENCTCGQTLLQLVARGNSTIAELMRLSDYIPSVFRLETKSDQQRYGEVVLDFVYFKSPEVFSRKIESTQSLREIDEEITESHQGIVGRIYSVFEGIHRYISDLNVFLDELMEGLYIQLSLEGVFCDEDGKQLMCEALYLYGVMLLMMDYLFPGNVRERIIVAFHRHASQKTSSSTIEDVSKLMRSTGFSSQPGTKRPNNYPEDYFKRIELPESYIDLVLGYLRSDDIYHQVQAYSSPEHRSTALANQASMLYVCLYFCPSTLHNHSTRMREIVDRFFSDNWVVSFYMGRTINLADAWEPYRAAKQALANSFEVSNVRMNCKRISTKLESLLEKTDRILADGFLSEARVLEQSLKLTNILRECNVVLRWIILHTAQLSSAGGEMNKRCAALRNLVVSEMKFNPYSVFNLLLSTAILELSMSKAYSKLLEEKSSKWVEYRNGAKEHISELSEVFSGNRPLARVPRNDKLCKWFKDIGEQIVGLSLEDGGVSERKLIQMIQAMKEVKEYHGLEASAGVIQAVDDVVKNLQVMSKVAGISDDTLVTLALISDLSYAWSLIDQYTSIMQTSIKKDPSQVGRLRALFLKLASGLELPLLRINQAKSPDLMSVSSYYSGQLVNYIRNVLQIIPETMFSLLKQISFLQSSMKPLPFRLEKEKIREFAQPENRYKMSELTQRVALLADGVSMMESTLVGVVQVDPKKLLEEGVRRELVMQVAQALHTGLVLNSKAKGSDLQKKLSLVGSQMKSFCVSFEYIQDYINMYCHKMWQEEVARIVSYNVQQECNALLKKQVPDFESQQSAAIPIPKYSPLDGVSVNFVGRLLREILRISDPKCSLFYSQLEKWYDTKSHAEVLSGTIVKEIRESIGIAGVVGIDRLLAFLIVKDLQDIVRQMDKFHQVTDNCISLESLVGFFSNPSSNSFHSSLSNWTQRNLKFCNGLINLILRVGQMQILRSLIMADLYSICKLQSKSLSASLIALNESLLMDLRKSLSDPSQPSPDPENILTSELSNFLEWSGVTEPLQKIYITPKPFLYLPILIVLSVISLIGKFKFSKTYATENVKGSSDILDGESLVTGIASLFRQFHPDYLDSWIRLMANYSNSMITVVGSSQFRTGQELPLETVCVLTIVQEVARKMKVPKVSLTTFLPDHLLTSV